MGAARAELAAFGLSWDLGLFIQSLWLDGEFSYLILNATDEAVDVVVDTGMAGDCGAYVTTRAAGPWTIAARSHQIVSGSEVMSLFGRETSWFVNDTPLGWDHPYQRPAFSNPAPVVSTHGTNGGAVGDLSHVESDFVVAPGPTFTMTVAVPPGELTLPAGRFSESELPVLDILAVRSEQATVSETASGFSVVVPYPDDDAELYEFDFPGGVMRVDVDVAVPPGTGDAPGIFFDSFFCAVGGSQTCSRGYPMERLVPLNH